MGDGKEGGRADALRAKIAKNDCHLCFCESFAKGGTMSFTRSSCDFFPWTLVTKIEDSLTSNYMLERDEDLHSWASRIYCINSRLVWLHQVPKNVCSEMCEFALEFLLSRVFEWRTCKAAENQVCCYVVMYIIYLRLPVGIQILLWI